MFNVKVHTKFILMQTAGHLIDFISLIFFISLFSPLSDHGFVGNSDKKTLCSVLFVFSPINIVIYLLW